jgi:predicted enzyme related to lactoylglutathione lyase
MKDYDNFFLPANDLGKAKDFFRNTLGLPIKFDFSERGMVAFKVGDQEPAIILKDTNKFQNVKPAIWLVVESVKEKYTELTGKGVRFLSEPFRIPTGMAVEFEDPFKNRLGITDYSKENDQIPIGIMSKQQLPESSS